MTQEQGMGASLRDRATAVEPVPVSPLRDGIAGAARKLLRWAFPTIAAFTGTLFLVVAGQRQDFGGVLCVIIGTVLILGALDARAGRAKADEQNRWAKVIADMVSSDKTTKFKVQHSFDSLRPELDELVAQLVAQGMSAFGENSRSEVEGEARQPGPSGCAQHTPPTQDIS